MQPFSITRKLFGKEITLETGVLARQAAGSVLVTLEGTQVLATATMSREPVERDFFPLSVDYIEKFYANGKIPGSYNRREGRPSDHEVLVSRLIDRPIRPLFEAGFRNEVQVIVTVLSIDGKNPSDLPSMLGAFAALLISSIPFTVPLAAVRMGRVGETFVVNPTYEQLKETTLDLIVAGRGDTITMVEGSAKEISEADFLKALETAKAALQAFTDFLTEFHKQVGKEKAVVELVPPAVALRDFLKKEYYRVLEQALQNEDKKDRESQVHMVYKQARQVLEEREEFEASKSQVEGVLHDFESEIVRRLILEKGARVDGRALDEIRPVDLRLNVLGNAHGSAIFTRGQTQALAVVALGSSRAQQKIDLTKETFQKTFFLHYNFPPYCVGEVGRLSGTSRREIGHGMLAERALAPLLPPKKKFNYTIRLVSEILESNGSSSMATVCAGSLALMEAGIPLERHVAGIAMGLVIGENPPQYRILTDIQGLEDSLGDMDFKVAGTRKGITGFQLDLKVDSITLALMSEALEQAKQARMQLLDKMEAALPIPSAMKECAPKHHIINIRVDKIKSLIGIGGKNIKGIVETTGSDVEVEDSGAVSIFANDEASLKKTLDLIEYYTGVPKVGKIYEGKVKSITAFGAFVEILPGVDGLCHISKLGPRSVRRVEEVVSLGETVAMKVIRVDEQGRISLALEPLKKELET